VDFTNTIIISTSNVGSDLIRRNLEKGERDRRSHPQLKDDLMVLLRAHFRPEFLNRIDEIIVFHALTREEIAQIVGLQLVKVQRMAHGQGVTLEWDDSLVEHLAEAGYQPEFGARELRRKIRSEVDTTLASSMLRGEIKEGDTIRFRYDRDSVKVRWEKVTPRKAAPAPTASAAPAPKRGRRPAAGATP